MTLAKIDLLDRKFPQSLLGYRRDDVDRLVAEAAETIGCLAEEKMALTRTLESLRRELGAYQGREATLRDTLLTTQRIVEDLKAEARHEAERILSEAREAGAAMIREAEDRVEALKRETEALEARRGALVTRFRDMLLATLDVLDQKQAAQSDASGEHGGVGVEPAPTEDFLFSEPADGVLVADNEALKDHGTPESEQAG